MSNTKVIDGVEFHQVLGFPGYYVNASGDVMSYRKQGCGMTLHDRPHRLRPTSDSDGYKQVTLLQDGREYTKKIHRLVLEAFVGPRPPEMQCRHLDGSRDNNDISNLRWGTQSENAQDRISHGRGQQGEHNANAKLTAAQVLTIRRISARGRTTYRKLAQQFGIGKSMVGFIVQRKHWTHI